MKKISGLITALVTPFKSNKIDYDSLEKLIHNQLSQGVEGFVINGTTAESPTLASQEVEEIFKFISKLTNNKVPLIMGTGTNSTAETIIKTKKAADLGAEAALVVVPYYNKPPQRGLFQHFEAVASASSLPIILYNVPGRTITALEIDTVQKLSQNPKIIGIKEASGQTATAKTLRSICRKDFILLSGDDGTYVDFLEAGGDGVISVTSHIMAKEMLNWRTWFLNNELPKAKNDLERLLPLIQFLFVEANPIPVKKALQLQKIISSAELRLPLVEMDEKLVEPLKQLMKKAGLI